jgi:hypothetical protein
VSAPVRGAAEDLELQLDDEPTDIDPAVMKVLLAELDKAVTTPTLFDEKQLASLQLPARGAILRGRAGTATAQPTDGTELNRIVIERLLAPGLHQTASPSVVEKLEAIDRSRAAKEPALRSTGRFLQERGALLQQPTPPEVALVDGIYSPGDVRLALMAGHVPFALLRNADHRRQKLAEHRFILVAKSRATAELQGLLVAAAAQGAVVFLPPGYTGGDVAGSRQWDPKQFGTRISGNKGLSFSGGYPAFRQHVAANATRIRQQLKRAGWRPRVDCDRKDVFMRTFDTTAGTVLFVVNNRRGETPTAGIPADIAITLGGPLAGARVVRLQTGEQLAVGDLPTGKGFTDTLPAAWYRLYLLQTDAAAAVPPALPTAPPLHRAAGVRDGRGTVLTWQPAAKNWAGSDVQWLQVERTDVDGGVRTITVYARDVTGPGGFRTEWTDASAATDATYRYRVQLVTPLRVPGPWAEVQFADD